MYAPKMVDFQSQIFQQEHFPTESHRFPRGDGAQKFKFAPKLHKIKNFHNEILYVRKKIYTQNEKLSDSLKFEGNEAFARPPLPTPYQDDTEDQILATQQ